jgi:hypothetical protein
MKITEDVIADLLPLYDSGEASPGTRALVEEYLAANPGFARIATEAREGAAGDRSKAAIPAGAELAVVARARRAVRLRSWIFGFALFCTFIPLSFGSITTDDGRWTFLMWRDVPASRLLWIVAAGLWLEYVRISRKLRVV